MARTDYLDDPDAPIPNSMVPSVNVLVTDDTGRILLIRRTDNGNYALPGGAIDLGESLTQAAVRETKEETGVDIVVTGLVGIYTDPGHVIAYSDGEIRQEFSIVLTGRPSGGKPMTSSESSEVLWIDPTDLTGLVMHPSMRKRIGHYLDSGTTHPHLS